MKTCFISHLLQNLLPSRFVPILSWSADGAGAWEEGASSSLRDENGLERGSGSALEHETSRMEGGLLRSPGITLPMEIC